MIAILFILISGFVFQYISWRRLHLEYHDRKVLIAYLWLAPIVFLVCARLGKIVFAWNLWELRILDIVGFWRKPGFDLISGVFFLIVFSMFYAYRNKIKVWPFLEDLWFSFWLYLLSWVLFLGFEKNFSWRLELILLVNLVIIFIFNLLLGKRYRSWVLYPSGKKGFLFWLNLGLAGLGIGVGMAYFKEGNLLVALGMGLVSLLGWFGLYFLGKID